MFFFRADIILSEYQDHLPEVLDLMEGVSAASGPKEYNQALEHAYRESPSISVDYGIMEHSKRIVTIPSSMGWSDVGNWRALIDFRDDGQDCYTMGEVMSEETTNSVLVADEGVTLVTLGVSNLAVVACKDVTLVLPIDRAQEVKDLVDLARKRGKEALLD
jgi:mannose-1-phosphate guanylyltransferase